MGALFSKGKEKGFAGLPIYSVTVDRGLVPRDSLDRHMANDADDHLNQVVDVGDLAYNTMRMWQGAAGIAEEKCMVSPAYVVVRPKSGVASKLFYYWFDNARMRYLLWAYSYGLTSDRLRLYFDDFAKIPVTIPKYSEQQKIADFLTAVDTKIEQLTRKEELLKQYKKGVMQKIFSQEIRFKADDGSEFPEWGEMTLGDLGKFYRGHSYDSSNVQPNGLLVLRSSNIQDGKLVLNKDLQFVNKDCMERIVLRNKDIVICMANGSKALVGKSGVYHQDYEGKVTIGAFCSIYRSMSPIAPYLLQTDQYQKYLHVLLAGTNINNLKNSDLADLEFDLPTSDAEALKIENFLKSIDHKIELAGSELETAKTFKKGLLQQMFV